MSAILVVLVRKQSNHLYHHQVIIGAYVFPAGCGSVKVMLAATPDTSIEDGSVHQWRDADRSSGQVKSANGFVRSPEEAESSGREAGPKQTRLRYNNPPFFFRSADRTSLLTLIRQQRLPLSIYPRVIVWRAAAGPTNLHNALLTT